ncbi:MAG: sigma-70 family RNA polymerase sigma factor [Gemmataceae bacterium]|nr:sigma-70 family RNA polymerase sigma factor [Gemmataceae bacterium]
MDSAAHTSPTLLARLGGSVTDAAAWDQFVRRYGGRVLGWCRHWGLQPADAEDVCQDVLLKVARQMRTFRYEPGKSFRGWLKTVARSAWCDWLEARRKQAQGSGDTDARAVLESVAAQDDLVRRLEDEFDRELLDLATARVRLRVEPATWEAFRLTAVDGLPAAEAAAKTGLKVATVFVAKGRVQKMLQGEIHLLDRDG